MARKKLVDRAAIGRRLKKCRELRDIKRKEVAAALGKSVAQIRRYEQGIHLTIDCIEELAFEYNVNHATILLSEDEIIDSFVGSLNNENKKLLIKMYRSLKLKHLI